MRNLMIAVACIAVICGSVFLGGGGAASSVYAGNATAPILTPQAWYQFDDAGNIGKDSTGNNHLLMADTSNSAVAEIKQDTDGENYLRLVRSASNQGKGLYAPKIADGTDFSDLIKNSFSVEITFRSDISAAQGDHYLLTVGSYFDSLSVRQWGDKIDIITSNRTFAPEGTSAPGTQGYVDWRSKYTLSVPYTRNTWATLLITADQEDKTVTAYIDGVQKGKIEDVDVLLTYQSNYAFALGMQSSHGGNATAMYANTEIKDCKVFDYALTAGNAKALYTDGSAEVSDEVTYITAIQELELDEMTVTDLKTPETLAGQLSKKVQASLSTGVSINCDVVWYKVPGESRLRGYIQSPFANVKGLDYSINLVETMDFDYNPELVTVSEIKLNGVDFVPGTEINTNNINVLTFKITVVGDNVIEKVLWKDDNIRPQDGVYEVTTKRGVTIVILAGVQKYTVSYYDGIQSLGTSTYTKGGVEKLSSFTKVGYTFEGWYSDAGLTQKFTELNYSQPTDLKLYAKYVLITEPANKGNTTAYIIGGTIGTVVLGGGVAATVILMKRKSRSSK